MWGEASTSPIPVIAESVWTLITTVSCAPSLAVAETFGIRSGMASISVIFMVLGPLWRVRYRSTFVARNLVFGLVSERDPFAALGMKPPQALFQKTAKRDDA